MSHKFPLRAALAAVLLLSLTADAALADKITGNAAFKAGNYAVALKELLPEAAKGNADAQAKVGIIYLEGKGIARNYAQAGKWLIAAARAGNPEAQRSLAQMYRLGLGLPNDDG